MTYKETLAYLYSMLPAYQKIGSKAMKVGLDNILRLATGLGNPHEKYPCIHVGGTNGKGSTSSMIASILQRAGYKVGLYTSPHLVSFTERIRINGQNIPEEAVVKFVERARPLIESIQPSFFELTAAMGFAYFAESEVDIAVIEVGLGGRLDATNIITPEVSVITNISYDHQRLLGDTLAQIAGEKAGIIKEGKPIVIGETHPETEGVFQSIASERKAPLIFANQHIDIVSVEASLAGQNITLRFPRGNQEAFFLDLLGSYQSKNLRTTLTAIMHLQVNGWEISLTHIKEGLAAVQRLSGLKGRMQCLQTNPTVLCDTGHNVAGIEEVVKQLLNQAHKHLRIVWGLVKDKDARKMMALLPKSAIYYYVKARLPRAASAESLYEMGGTLGFKGQVYSSVKEGYKQALEDASTEDLVFVGGSTFVVAEVLE